ITHFFKAVGQSEWAEFFPDCGGFSQSPIDVDTSRTLYDPSLAPVQPLGYGQYGHEPFTLSNSGHTGNLLYKLYANISQAKTERNGLAVLGVLLEAGSETNQAYAHILNYLGRIRYAGQKVAIPAFDVQTLLPKDLSHYFRYNGSLTTPPCYQSVLWTIFSEKVKISHSQVGLHIQFCL
uniref:Carbonic anhydrase XIV n=1 Tax=Astyanax mexicanus TaxID=7994 RepID=A0A8B9HI23_ASTMX